MIDKVDKLVEDYCAKIGLPVEILKKKGHKKPRVYNGMLVPQARNALCYYILDRFRHLSQNQVCRRIGYSDHSSWSKQWKLVKHRIDTKEEVLYPYYEELLKVAENGKNN